jgi:hypothetical protein
LSGGIEGVDSQYGALFACPHIGLGNLLLKFRFWHVVLGLTQVKISACWCICHVDEKFCRVLSKDDRSNSFLKLCSSHEFVTFINCSSVITSKQREHLIMAYRNLACELPSPLIMMGMVSS